MSDADDPTVEFALIEAVAAALREEFLSGAPIEEQPGFHDPSEAGQVNRAFRVTARSILRAIGPPDEDLEERLSLALNRLARRRLETGLLDARAVERLLVREFRVRDDWLVFPILTPWSEVEFLGQARGPDVGP